MRQQGQQQAGSKEPLACDSALDSLLLQRNPSPSPSSWNEQPRRARFALHRALSMASGSLATSASCQGEGEAGGRGGVGRGLQRKRTHGHTVSRSLGSDPRLCPFEAINEQAQSPLPPLGDALIEQSRVCAGEASAGGPEKDVRIEGGQHGPGGTSAFHAHSPAWAVCWSGGLSDCREQDAVQQSQGLKDSDQSGSAGSEARARHGAPLQWPEYTACGAPGEGCPAADAEPESAPDWQSGDHDEEYPSSRFLGCSWKKLIPNPVVRARLREFDLLDAANSAGSSPRQGEGLERCATTQPALLSWALSSVHSEAPGSPLVRTHTIGVMGSSTPCCGTPLSSGGTPGGSSDASPVLRRRVTASRSTVVDDCWLTGPQRQRKCAGEIVVEELEQHRREDVAKLLDDFSEVPGIKRKRL